MHGLDGWSSPSGLLLLMHVFRCVVGETFVVYMSVSDCRLSISCPPHISPETKERQPHLCSQLSNLFQQALINRLSVDT